MSTRRTFTRTPALTHSFIPNTHQQLNLIYLNDISIVLSLFYFTTCLYSTYLHRQVILHFNTKEEADGVLQLQQLQQQANSKPN